jgi:hypothetical protein
MNTIVCMSIVSWRGVHIVRIACLASPTTSATCHLPESSFVTVKFNFVAGIALLALACSEYRRIIFNLVNAINLNLIRVSPIHRDFRLFYPQSSFVVSMKLHVIDVRKFGRGNTAWTACQDLQTGS